MSKRSLQITASVLILGALGLLVAGLDSDAPMIWGAGLVAVALAMIISLATRWAKADSR